MRFCCSLKRTWVYKPPTYCFSFLPYFPSSVFYQSTLFLHASRPEKIPRLRSAGRPERDSNICCSVQLLSACARGVLSNDCTANVPWRSRAHPPIICTSAKTYQRVHNTWFPLHCDRRTMIYWYRARVCVCVTCSHWSIHPLWFISTSVHSSGTYNLPRAHVLCHPPPDSLLAHSLSPCALHSSNNQWLVTIIIYPPPHDSDTCCSYQ